MLSAEGKKILIKQKGLIIIVVMVLLKIILTVNQGYESNYTINRNPEGYAYYINLYEGKLTEETEKALQAEYNEVVHAAGKLDELVRQRQEGELDQKVYEETSREYYERLKNRSVFQLVYNQYHYAREAPDERYMMDQRGWTTLLGQDRPDFVLLLCLIMVLTPLFCHEYESGMNALLLSSANGRDKTGAAKLLNACALVIFLIVLFSLIEYCYLGMTIGLPNGSFPLQSLEFFADSQYRITLKQAFLLVILCRILGGLLLAGCVSLVGILSKKTIMTLFLGSVLVFLPYILFQGKATMYYLPLPSGLLAGTGYLWGTSYITTIGEQGIERLVQFQQIDKKIFVFLLAVYVLEIGLLFLCCLKKYSGYTLKGRLTKKKRIGVTTLLVFLALWPLIGTGCAATEKVQDSFTFHALEERESGETNEYDVRLDYIEGLITAKDLKTGEEILLTRDPFEREDKISAIFVRDGWCYYVTQTLGIDGIRIYGIDMENFKEKLIYNSVEENTEDYFGIVSKEEDGDEAFRNISPVYYFFLNENYIYYVIDSDLIQINRQTGKEIVVAQDVKGGHSLVYHNGDVYYIDLQYRLSIFKENESQVHKVSTVYTDYFTIVENRVMYRDLLDDKQMRSYDIN